MPKLESIQVVYKKSPYEIYVGKYKDPTMKALLEQEDPSVGWMLSTHEENQTALAHVRAVLKQRKIRTRWSYRAKPERAVGVDLVLAVGGDGTLLEAARMTSGQVPLMGVRSTPSQSVGYLCAGDAQGLDELLDAYLDDQLPYQEVSRIQVLHNGEPVLPLALNDVLFSHVSPAATSRYAISLRDQQGEGLHESHRSSGLWVATATGSTAAIRSAGGEVRPIHDEALQFVVRELYIPDGTPPAGLDKGFFEAGDTLELQSQMRRACLFFDGPWVKRPVLFGDLLQFRAAKTPLILVAPGRERSPSFEE